MKTVRRPEKNIAGKRMVFKGTARSERALHDVSEELELSKVKTIQLGISMLAQIVQELDKGSRLVFRNPDGSEREIIIPQLGLSRENQESSTTPAERVVEPQKTTLHHA